MGPPEDPGGARALRVDRLPARLAERVRPLPEDPWVEAFAREATGHGALRDALRRTLRRVVSDFDADGLLGTHPMALFGEASWRDLLGPRRRLLDVGAGSGDVTVHARATVGEIVTTELSAPMARRLRRLGFTCHQVDLAWRTPAGLGRFDAVSLCNVLDRCERPRSLLRAAASVLEPGGALVATVPLPARPHFDVGAATIDPDEPLGGEGDDFESALVDLVERTFEPSGLTLERLARAPYLSRGRDDALHRLDAAVIVLSA
ncbi:MAG: methyltransferase domain-containing protein [Sandaracinaceae bacterium]|nr:methyltransferase domain-containing protein [Sandaracinaceae bacterium]